MKHEIYIVGMGPGREEDMTQEALTVLDSCDVIVGYTVYLNLLGERFLGKTFLSTPMRQEVERCRMCYEEAKKGKRVALICSGDAGIYGMAGPILELGEKHQEVEIEVIPGITAALSGGAVLGAPLMHDFAVISLSDLLTPWEKIETRLRCAAEADFSICIYNPSSKKRADYLKRACDIILGQTKEDRVCGIVSNIGREGQNARVLMLSELRDTRVDMFTTVFIGNSQTKRIGERMVTPRGYRI